MYYKQVFIKSKDDLPKEGIFWVHQKIYEDIILQKFDFNTPHRKLWESDIDWYLQPIEQIEIIMPTEEEIEDLLTFKTPYKIEHGESGDAEVYFAFSIEAQESIKRFWEYMRDEVISRNK